MDIFTDPRDGEVYKTVEINGQIWMAENLRYKGPVKKFNDWTVEEKDFYIAPNGDRNNIKEYGCLYTWNNALKAIPDGWHLPTKKEFETLLTNVGYNDEVLSIVSMNLRAASFDNGKDIFGFGGLPSGYYYCGSQYFFGYGAFFWSSTELNSYYAYNLCLGGDGLVDGVADVNLHYKDGAFSVRCIKN